MSSAHSGEVITTVKPLTTIERRNAVGQLIAGSEYRLPFPCPDSRGRCAPLDKVQRAMRLRRRSSPVGSPPRQDQGVLAGGAGIKATLRAPDGTVRTMSMRQSLAPCRIGAD